MTAARSATRLPARSVPVQDEVSLRDVLGGEWIKLRSLRSTRWTLLATAVLVLGFSTLAVHLLAGNYAHLSASDRTALRQDPIGLILQPGMVWGEIAVCVLAALTITAEYTTGAIRSIMLAVPARVPVLVAKAALIAMVAFVAGDLLAFVSYLLGAPVVNQHVPISLSDGWVLRSVLGAGLFLAAIAVLALSVGALCRNTAAGITAAVGLVFVAPNAAGFIPGRAGDYVSAYLPGGQAGQMILTSGHDPNAVVGPWPGLLVAVGWALVALTAAVVAVRHRDV